MAKTSTQKAERIAENIYALADGASFVLFSESPNFPREEIRRDVIHATYQGSKKPGEVAAWGEKKTWSHKAENCL